MLGRLLVTASFAALLSVAPAIAQESQQPIYKPPASQGGQGTMNQGGQSGEAQQSGKVIQPPAEENSNQATGNQPQPQEDQATGEAGQKTKKIQQNTQSEQPSTGQQAEEGMGQGQKTKKIQQNTQSDQSTGQTTKQNQQATGESGQKTKKIQQGQKTEGSEQTTTGATGKISTEIPAKERTVIREKLVSSNVTRIDRSKINFNITVGVVVPRTIELLPLPVEVVELVPAYEGYLYFVLADGTIVIVEPGSLQIVTVLTA
jgi:hypothetical protein